jgi:hypothetical protein
MTIGKLGDPNPAPYFEELVRCKEDVMHKLSLKEEEVSLSMGMSSDFELAISCGSNNVRVGSTIFGARPAKKTVAELKLMTPEKRCSSGGLLDPLAPHPASVPEDTVLKDEG